MGLDTELPKLIEEHQPRQGVHCLLYRKEDNPTLAIYGSVRAGTAFEPGDRLGIAELTSRLLIRGTGKLGSPKIANMLESVGATLSFRNAQDNIILQARTTSTWTQRLLGIISACLTEPSFNRRDVEREKEELLTDIRLRDDDTTRRGMKELHSLVYPTAHPYRRDRFGTPASVKKIERDEVVEYFEETVSKAPVVVAFAGRLEKSTVLGWMEKTFGEREEDPDPANKDPQPPHTKPESKEVVMAHKTQADVLM
ncbi:MAG TPA: insulinase family protein, partial [Candidatus Bathyarchaeia archaeon]|nr:insulinase family protein [Candidatus Bathyarchaeia archaeon]